MTPPVLAVPQESAVLAAVAVHSATGLNVQVAVGVESPATPAAHHGPGPPPARPHPRPLDQGKEGKPRAVPSRARKSTVVLRMRRYTLRKTR